MWVKFSSMFCSTLQGNSKHRARHDTIFMLLCAMVFASCSFDYESVQLEEQLDERVPDIILENARLVFVRGTEIEIDSEKIEIFSSQRQQSMINVTFIEETKSGEVRMEGRADKISIETENNNITMVGNITARSHNDKAEIHTDYLYWSDEERIIQGSTVSKVTIEKDIGSVISGYNFRGDTEKREITISGEVSGKLVVDE